MTVGMRASNLTEELFEEIYDIYGKAAGVTDLRYYGSFANILISIKSHVLDLRAGSRFGGNTKLKTRDVRPETRDGALTGDLIQFYIYPNLNTMEEEKALEVVEMCTSFQTEVEQLLRDRGLAVEIQKRR